jgi:photosystem II stability/assembly factor-like uncharacterized protein
MRKEIYATGRHCELPNREFHKRVKDLGLMQWPLAGTSERDRAMSRPPASAILIMSLLTASCGLAPRQEPQPLSPTLEFPPAWTPTPSQPVQTATRAEPSPSVAASPTPLPSPAATLQLGNPDGYEPIEHLTPETPLQIDTLTMIDENHGWAVGYPGWASYHILITEDGARSWRDVTPPVLVPASRDSAGAVATFLDASHAWVVYTDMLTRGCSLPIQAWRTADAGETWQRTQALGLGVAPVFTLLGMSFVDNEAGWLFAAVGCMSDPGQRALFRTVDGGETWEILPLAKPGDGDLLATGGWKVRFAGQRTGMATPRDPLLEPFVLWTDDGGLTWIRSELPTPSWFPSFFETYFAELGGCTIVGSQLISDQSAVVLLECLKAGGEDRALYRTGDGGQTWEASPVPSDAGSPEFLDPSTGWLFGRVIYSTRDGGKSWLKVREVDWDGFGFTFVNPMLGWAIAAEPAYPGMYEYAVVHTTDGGRTWQKLMTWMGL